MSAVPWLEVVATAVAGLSAAIAFWQKLRGNRDRLKSVTGSVAIVLDALVGIVLVIVLYGVDYAVMRSLLSDPDDSRLALAAEPYISFVLHVLVTTVFGIVLWEQLRLSLIRRGDKPVREKK